MRLSSRLEVERAARRDEPIGIADRLIGMLDRATHHASSLPEAVRDTTIAAYLQTSIAHEAELIRRLATR